MTEITTKIADLIPRRKILQGYVLGVAHTSNFSEKLKVTDLSEFLVRLDFTGIEAATASYLKLFLANFFAAGKYSESAFPTLTGLTTDLREDLHSFLSEKGWLLVEVESDHSFKQLLGTPEPATEITFNLLRETGQASALTLFDLCGEKHINPTAWNNRLINLLKLRLAHRTRAGRTWVYKTITN